MGEEQTQTASPWAKVGDALAYGFGRWVDQETGVIDIQRQQMAIQTMADQTALNQSVQLERARAQTNGSKWLLIGGAVAVGLVLLLALKK